MTATEDQLEERYRNRREIDLLVKTRMEQLQRETSFVCREEFEAVAKIAQETARLNESLTERLARLEAKLA